jgi:thiol-disulfide isomerase/thioredoxin
MKSTLKNTFLTFLLMFTAIMVFAQNEITLKIGDPAPGLQYSKWIKGEPVVTSFDGDQLYVLEFWATWCGPCKAAMPHLTELQKQYQGKVRFIGVNVWEGQGAGKQPYETYLPKVADFVKGNSANMGYSVVADNNDEYMAAHWLKASGQPGIPASFIVKDKKIIWIGHPMKLDSILPKILDGGYDMQAYTQAYTKLNEQQRKQSEEQAAMFKPISDAIKAKDYQLAFDEMDKLKAAQPKVAQMMNYWRFTVLLKSVSEKDAIAFAETWQKDYKGAPISVLSEVIKSKYDTIVSKGTYLWAAKNFEANGTIPGHKYAFYSALATCYAKAGDFKTAGLNAEKALEEAKAALSEGADKNITEKTVTEIQKALDNYKAGKLAVK